MFINYLYNKFLAHTAEKCLIHKTDIFYYKSKQLKTLWNTASKKSEYEFAVKKKIPHINLKAFLTFFLCFITFNP